MTQPGPSDSAVGRQNVSGGRTNYMYLCAFWGTVLLIIRGAVKQAKCQYLSDIILNNGHCPRVLFSTINSVVNSQNSYRTDASVSTCEDFLNFFIDKVMSVRQLTSCSVSTDLSVNITHSAVFDCFEPVSLSLLTDVIQHMRTTNCPLDIFPTKL